MATLRNALSVLCTAILTSVALAAPSDDVVQAWLKGNALSMESGLADAKDRDRISVEKTPSSDGRIELSFTQDGAPKKVRAMSIAGTFVANDPSVHPARLIFAAHQLEFMSRLLAYAAGSAPADIHGKKPVHVEEAKAPSRTLPDLMDFGTPWRLDGFVKSEKQGVVSFDLTQTVTRPDGGKAATHYVGTWEQRAGVSELDDALSVSGWKVIDQRPPHKRAESDAKGVVYKTVGDVRLGAPNVAGNAFVTRQEHRRASLAESEKKLAEATTDEARFYAATTACDDANALEDFKKAVTYGDQALKLSEAFKSSWNYGNAVHHGHLARGHAALARNDVDAAVAELHAAGETPGSPQLDSFGPNMALANALLARGKRDAVLAYLEQCRKFWKPEFAKLDAWKADIEAGKAPDFGGNLAY